MTQKYTKSDPYGMFYIQGEKRPLRARRIRLGCTVRVGCKRPLRMGWDIVWYLMTTACIRYIVRYVSTISYDTSDTYSYMGDKPSWRFGFWMLYWYFPLMRSHDNYIQVPSGGLHPILGCAFLYYKSDTIMEGGGRSVCCHQHHERIIMW